MAAFRRENSVFSVKHVDSIDKIKPSLLWKTVESVHSPTQSRFKCSQSHQFLVDLFSEHFSDCHVDLNI